MEGQSRRGPVDWRGANTQGRERGKEAAKGGQRLVTCIGRDLSILTVRLSEPQAFR